MVNLGFQSQGGPGLPSTTTGMFCFQSLILYWLQLCLDEHKLIVVLLSFGCLVTESQKQIGGPVDSNMHQPVGLHLATTAASVIAGALGGPQVGSQFTQSNLQVPASDPLALHLAKMSRSQLTEIISSIKVWILISFFLSFFGCIVILLEASCVMWLCSLNVS